MGRLSHILVCLLLITAVALPRQAVACPFCSAVSLTFAQEIEQSQVAVIAKLVKRPDPGALAPRAEGPLPKGAFEVVEVLKGSDLLEAAGHSGAGAKPIETIFLDEKPVGSLFLLLAVEPPQLVWSSPIAITEKTVGYLKKLPSLPASGPDRLAFFQEHLEDPDEVLARDAYDEFAIASYADLKGLEDRMDPSQLLAWIEDPKVQASRRRLYATMLGVCGTKADAERIARILTGEGLGEKATELRAGLDALIACHATLTGEEGLDLVDRLFLDRSRKDVPFTETYAAVMALRFLGEEKGIVPRERVVRSLRLLLDEPKLADLVIADLARWEDWTVLERLVEIFEKATSDNIFVREPIVNYLRACPKPEAAEAIKRLEKIDPEAVKRAATLAAFAGAAAVKPKPADGEGDGTPSEIPGAPLAGIPLAAEPVVDEPLANEDAADEGRDESLSGRLAPVLGDTDPENRPAPAAPTRDASSRPFPLVRWIVWAAIVAAVAVLSRAVLRPDSRSG